MSRYGIDARNPNHEVAVGWDTPMRTYFAQVHDTRENVPEEEALLFWIGGKFDDLKSLDLLVAAVAPYADIPTEIQNRLRADKPIQITDFTDERIAQIHAGTPAMTPEERQFLLNNTPTFEECALTKDQLAALDDKDLMREAYSIWSDYASGQI